MTREKGREPKKPREAESGEGCTDSTQGTGPSIPLSDWASRPHKIAASGPPRAASTSMARAVTASQPRPRCEADSPGRTVSTRLSSITPCSVQAVRSPCAGGSMPMSVRSSA